MTTNLSNGNDASEQRSQVVKKPTQKNLNYQILIYLGNNQDLVS